jgi:hypothetical protein
MHFKTEKTRGGMLELTTPYFSHYSSVKYRKVHETRCNLEILGKLKLYKQNSTNH